MGMCLLIHIHIIFFFFFFFLLDVIIDMLNGYMLADSNLYNVKYIYIYIYIEKL